MHYNHLTTGSVRPAPPLDAETERTLCYKAQAGDREAAQRVIEANARWLAKRAEKLAGDTCPAEDLFQAGVEGLLRALTTWHGSTGSNIRAFARQHVWGAMTQAVSDYSAGLAVPRRTRQRHGYGVGGQVADVQPDTLPGVAATFVDEVLNREEVLELLGVLDQRERDVVKLYYGLGCRAHTDEEASMMVGLSRRRTAEVRAEAVAKMRAASTQELGLGA